MRIEVNVETGEIKYIEEDLPPAVDTTPVVDATPTVDTTSTTTGV